MKTKSLALMGLTILLASTLVACSDDSSNKNSSESKTENVTKKKATKKDAKSKDQLGLTKSEVEGYNQSLIDGLNEDKSFLNSGDDGYDFVKYIDMLSYDSNRGLKISVSTDFLNLSDDDKNTVAGDAVGLAESQLVIIGKNNDGDKTIQSNVYQGNTKLGSAKFSNSREFNWK